MDKVCGHYRKTVIQANMMKRQEQKTERDASPPQSLYPGYCTSDQTFPLKDVRII
jgi:hypothetical protein